MFLKEKKFYLLSILFTLLGFAAWHSKASALTEDEKNNVSIYQKASASVVNVTSTVITRDFFSTPSPAKAAVPGRSSTRRGIS